MNARPEPTKPAFAVTVPATPHGIPLGWARAAGLLVFVSLILQHGFPVATGTRWWLHWLDVLLVLWFSADLILALLRARDWRRAFALRRFENVLLGGLLVVLILSWVVSPATIGGLLQFLHLGSAAALRSMLVKLFLLLVLCIQLLRGAQQLLGKNVRPELILAGSFAVLIVIGTFLLLLPNASARAEAPIGGLDALFTATSAVCVTGLVVRDTGTDFSNFGQMILLVLFQTGGLGIITFVGFLSIFSTRALPVPQMVAFGQIINAPALSAIKRQIVGILLATGIIEVIGAGLLFQFVPMDVDPLNRIKWSFFHSVSAFCNAGFALQSDSLMPFQTNPGLMLTFMGLIILGGLGFLVIPELLGYRVTRGHFFRRFSFFRRRHAGQLPGRLSVQARLSLIATGLLLMGGLVIFWLLESDHMLRDRPAGEAFLISAFQAVTPRTAGLNSVPIDQLQNATLVFLMILMVIGASPVSTGGGIKTATFAILLLAIRALVARRERVEVFGRAIPGKTLFAALGVFLLYVLTAGFCMFLLALCDPQVQVRDQAFEVISALSTVGLSTGITAGLSPASKLVLCAAMFVGRVGPISLVLSVFQSRRQLTYELPEEEVVVG